MFTKKDLKDRMVVETRDGCRYIVVGDRFMAEDGFMYIDEYDDNLLDVKRGGFSIFDVMKVFDVANNLSVLYKDKDEPIGLSVLFDRNDSNQQPSDASNENRIKSFCKQFANLYILDERKIYNHFLRILYNIYCITNYRVSVTNFDIEKCSEMDINEALRRLGIACANYYIIRNMEIGSDQDVY